MSQQQIVVPIGIDLGSMTSKIAVAKRGGVEIITNQANFRQTPCVVGYGPAERNIGQAGNIKKKSNFKDTVSFPSRFLGLRPDNPFLRAQKKFCSAKSTIKDDKVVFEVKYQGKTQALYPEQIFAAYLNKLKLIIQKNSFDNKSAVIAIPPYFTQFQRKAVLDAAKIAELGVTRLINESTAVALDYGMFRKNQLDATNPRNVLFIDFGHSKMSVFTCGFTNSQMHVLEQDYCRHLGTRDIDYHLYEFYRSHFQRTSGGCDLGQNRKAIVTLMENIQRQRKILSGNSQHDMNIEYLVQENDLHYTMKREQFERISQPIFRAAAQVLEKMRDHLKLKNINLHSIELVGGGTRIPAFVAVVKSVFGVEPSRTLNSSESVARGCALMAAIKSPLFRVPDYALNQKSYYGIKFYWNFVEGEKFLGLNSSLYPEKQGKFIYEAGAKVPSSKTVKFSRKQAIEILIQYEPCVNGFSKHIGYFVTKPQNPKEQTFGVTFKIKFNEDGLVVFDECNLIEEWFEQTKIPKKKAQNKTAESAKTTQGQPEKIEQQQFQIKKTKKQKYTAVKYDSNTFEAFTPKDIEAFFTTESTMLNQDKLIIETYQRKNELQSLAYVWKQKINSSHKEFTKPDEAGQILKFLEEQSQWLYNQGLNSNRGVYNQRITSVKNKISPIQKRYENFQAAFLQLKVLEDCVKYNMDFLNNLDKKYEHITEAQRQEGFSLIDRARSWVFNGNEKQKQLAKWEDLAITAQQIKEKVKEINDKVKTIMSKKAPPPPPKPQEKKEQATKKEGEPMQAEKKTQQTAEKMDMQ